MSWKFLAPKKFLRTSGTKQHVNFSKSAKLSTLQKLIFNSKIQTLRASPNFLSMNVVLVKNELTVISIASSKQSPAQSSAPLTVSLEQLRLRSRRVTNLILQNARVHAKQM